MDTTLALQIMKEHGQNGYRMDSHRVRLYVDYMDGSREEVIVRSIKQLLVQLGY